MTGSQAGVSPYPNNTHQRFDRTKAQTTKGKNAQYMEISRAILKSALGEDLCISGHISVLPLDT